MNDPNQTQTFSIGEWDPPFVLSEARSQALLKACISAGAFALYIVRDTTMPETRWYCTARLTLPIRNRALFEEISGLKLEPLPQAGGQSE